MNRTSGNPHYHWLALAGVLASTGSLSAEIAETPAPATCSVAEEFGRLGYTSTWVVQRPDTTITGYRFINLKTGARMTLTCIGPCPDILP